MTTRAERLAALAVHAGCELVGCEAVDVAGDTYASVRIRARDNEHAIALLNAIALDDATHEPEIGELGARFRAWGARHAAGDAGAIAQSIHGFVKEHVDFAPEEGEKFRSPSLTLRLGCGDCDDSAHVLASLGHAAGIPSRVAEVRDDEGDISHVAAQFFHDGAWHWAEATFDARYGAEPRAEAKRLGILRDDLA